MSETSGAPALGVGGWPRRQDRWFALGALAVAGLAFLVIIAVGGIGRNLVYYWGPTELRAAGDKAIGATIRLGGLVADGSVRAGARAPPASSSTSSTARAATVHVKCSGRAAPDVPRADRRRGRGDDDARPATSRATG